MQYFEVASKREHFKQFQYDLAAKRNKAYPKVYYILLNFAWDAPVDPADDDREAAVGSSNSCWPRMTPDLRDDDTESFIGTQSCDCFFGSDVASRGVGAVFFDRLFAL